MSAQGKKFTDKAAEALRSAHEAAAGLGHGYVGTEHILLGLTRTREGVAFYALKTGGVDEASLTAKLSEAVGRGEPGQTLPQGLTPRAKRVIDLAAGEAARLGHGFIGTEHLLMAVLRESDSMAARLLSGMNVDGRKLYAEVAKSIYIQVTGLPAPKAAPHKARAAVQTRESVKTLDRFGRDLTALALEGRLDPVVGRETEILRVIQILSRRQKNNPVLLGEPGVGKTAVAEGLAQRVTAGDVPQDLKDKRIVTLDMASMVAGTKYRGEFEERFRMALEETARAGNIILFVDEMHTLAGAGAAEGAIDAASILKPALARGELQLMGATTLDEYRRYIEKDAALERRFQPVTVGEPTPEQAERILFGLRDKYESHHRVRIADEAVTAAVRLSARYISDRYLPDKAIDLMDEACAARRMARLTPPPEIKALEAELNHLLAEKDAAIASQEFEAAAELRLRETQAAAELRRAEEAWRDDTEQSAEAIGEDDIAAVTSHWTGIPVARITEGETERLLQMESLLRARVTGQEEAVAAVTRAVRRGRMGLGDPKRPVGSFLFLGPTGVGKTELCKALALAQFGTEEALIRIDMSELMEKHAGSKLIGAPPGYVGYNEGGGLTEKVRRKPFSVVLLDEIEKAHPDILGLLLQVLEEGNLTDGSGRRVDFRNTILVMTSNIGARVITEPKRLGFAAGEGTLNGVKDAVLGELRREMNPEFLNRVDDILVFKSLEHTDMVQIARKLLAPLAERLLTRGVILEAEDSALAWLAEKGRDIKYGARPLRRLIQTEVQDPLTLRLLEDGLPFKVTLRAGVSGLEMITGGPAS